MSDPRKKFMCRKCGRIVVDTERQYGKDTPCDGCIRDERREYTRQEILKHGKYHV